MKEVGNVFNLSESRVSQMMSKLVNKINTKKPSQRRGAISYQNTVTVKGGSKVDVFKKKPIKEKNGDETSEQINEHI